jgi:hypothetical protein
MKLHTGKVTFWHPRHKFGFIQGDSGEKSIHFAIATHSVITEIEPGEIGFKKVPTPVCPKIGDKIIYSPTKREKKGPKTHRWAFQSLVPENDLLALSRKLIASDI